MNAGCRMEKATKTRPRVKAKRLTVERVTGRRKPEQPSAMRASRRLQAARKRRRLAEVRKTGRAWAVKKMKRLSRGR